MANRQRVPAGPAPDPAVQKIRVRYARRGRLRFSSTRDFQRALERAVRRAGVPVAFTAGFHPHPKISYANTAPTGVASEAEFFEISVTRELDPERLRAALDDALPGELVVLEAVTAAGGSLSDRLQASIWQLELPATEAPLDQLQEAVAELLRREGLSIARMTKTGEKQVDVRGAVVLMAAREKGARSVIEATVRHAVPAVRPADLLTALMLCGLPQPASDLLATRVTQGPLEGETVGDALAADQG